MNEQQAFEELMKYREGLIVNGKRVAMENPDRLTRRELEALVEKILNELNSIDMSLGYENYDSGIRNTHGVSEDRVQELYLDFLDWYDIVKTPSNSLFDYITQNYPLEKYRRILCVGDGQCSHLGRKLADKGYDVVSVDPLARKEFSTKRQERKTGKLHVVRGKFFRTSVDMINWADLIVGAKVPECAEELIGLNKESVFNISNNAQIYGMRFKGVPITSSKVLVDEITKCKNVTTKMFKRYGDDEDGILIFISKQREIEEELR